MSIIYGCGDPEFVGKIPARTEIEVLPADTYDKPFDHDVIVITPRNKIRRNEYNPDGSRKLGFTVRESIGIGVVNSRGVARGKKSVVVGE